MIHHIASGAAAVTPGSGSADRENEEFEMATQVTNYQCPACTGPLHFVGSSGRLECEYCGSSFDVAEIEALYAEKEAKAAEAAKKAEEKQAAAKEAAEAEKKAAADAGDGSDWDTSGLSDDWGADANGMKAYSCPSCGAELICDATTAATSCPYWATPPWCRGSSPVC